VQQRQQRERQLPERQEQQEQLPSEQQLPEPAQQQRELRQEQRLLLLCHKQSWKQPAEQPGERNISFDFPLLRI